MLKIGAHVKFSKAKDSESQYLVGAAKMAQTINANTIMIFLGPPQNRYRTSTSEYNLALYLEKYQNVVKPNDIVVHAPYIVNPSSPINAKFAEKLLIEDCQRMNYIGAKLMVLHPGAATKFPKEVAIKTLVTTLKNILNKTKKIIICLETMAGKGTEIGSNFAELALIIKQINSNRIGICLDTCHLWDAGYDLNDLDKLIFEIKKHNLLNKIKVIHLNDSKNPLGAAKDRHENIGQGLIGLKALKKIVHCPIFDNIPIILETPHVNKKNIYAQEIKLLLEK